MRSSVVDAIHSVFNESIAAAPSSAWFAYTLLSHSARKAGMQVFASNLLQYAHLIDPTEYPFDRVHPELYMVSSNLPEWRDMYLHEEYELWHQGEMARDSIDGHVSNLFAFCDCVFSLLLPHRSARMCMASSS